MTPPQHSARRRGEPAASHRLRIAWAFALYGGWTAATWYFEGRIETLLRPEAVVDRAFYAIVVNVLGAVVGGAALLHWLAQEHDAFDPRDHGFGTWPRALAWTIAAAALGSAAYVLQHPPFVRPAVLINAFAQVFVVSVAEVMVCWAVVGSIVEAALRPRFGFLATFLAAVLSAVLFGAYHFAHSAPFDSLSMVGLLSVVGLATSGFFFASRDVVATSVVQTFLGTLGVVQSLEAVNRLDSLVHVQPSLLGMAVLSVTGVGGAYGWIRRSA